jgi:hypothetical protein
MDVDEPAVERNLAARDPGGDRRVRAEMRKLDDDILQTGGANALLVGERTIAGAHHAFGGMAVAQPGGDIGHAFEQFGIHQRLHRAAVGMTADDDVAHAEREHGIFDGRRHAAILRRERRDDIAGIAAHEQVAGLGLHDQLGDDAAVGTGDDQGLGALPVDRELGIEVVAGKYALFEIENASDQIVHGRCSSWLVAEKS